MLRRSTPFVLAAGVAAALLVPAGVALADDSGRTGGSISPEAPTPANGGDQGWGNCGHNSSRGQAHTGDNGKGGGNGGDHGQSCLDVTPTPTPTDTQPAT